MIGFQILTNYIWVACLIYTLNSLNIWVLEFASNIISTDGHLYHCS